MFAWRRRIERSGCAISRGLQRAGRDLVQQRLEQVEVAAIDEGDVDRVLAPQRAGRVEPGEPAADDHDAMAFSKSPPARTAPRERYRSRSAAPLSAACAAARRATGTRYGEHDT